MQGASRRGWWGASAAALIGLFVVEASPLHVQVDSLSYGKLIYVPLLAGFAVCIWRLGTDSGQAALVRTSLAVLLASYAVHVFGLNIVKALGWGTGSWAYQVKVGLKEGSELAGWLLVLVSLWRSANLDERLGVAGKLVRRTVGRRTERA